MEVHPLTPDRWDDLEALFGPRGAYGGCWCMWPRLTAREFAANVGEPNRRALRAIVDEGRVPGLLAYEDGEPVGWVSVAPREELGRIRRSPVAKPVDEVPVWSVVCFYIHPRHRREGVGSALLEAAVRYAAERGAEAMEGYPVEPRKDRMPDFYAWRGVGSMFEAAGFREIARRRPGRPVMRRELR